MTARLDSFTYANQRCRESQMSPMAVLKPAAAHTDAFFKDPVW